MRYAKISNKVVADEYASVAEKVEALYSQDQPLEADAAGPAMRRLQHEVHHRLLGNGWCQRPAPSTTSSTRTDPNNEPELFP